MHIACFLDSTPGMCTPIIVLHGTPPALLLRHVKKTYIHRHSNLCSYSYYSYLFGRHLDRLKHNGAERSPSRSRIPGDRDK